MKAQMKNQTHRNLNLLLGISISLTQWGCGSSENVYAKYVTGRLTFASGITATAGAPIIIRYSSDNFATILGSTSIYNDQGLLTMPYRLDFNSNAGDFVQIQAFQDISFTGIWVYGAGSGRYDKTATGNAAYLSLNRVVGVTCSSDQSSSTSNCMNSANTFGGFLTEVVTLGLAQPDGSKTHYLSGADITLDSNTGL